MFWKILGSQKHLGQKTNDKKQHIFHQYLGQKTNDKKQHIFHQCTSKPIAYLLSLESSSQFMCIAQISSLFRVAINSHFEWQATDRLVGYFWPICMEIAVNYCPSCILDAATTLLLIQFSQCVGHLHGKLVGRQDRGGQGMNERGAILQRKEKRKCQ